jgi:nitroreductase
MTVGAGRESHAEDGTGPGGEGRVAGTAGLALMVPSAPPGSPVSAGPEAPVMEVLGYQAEHFDETPAVIAACYARPSVPRDPRLVAGLIRDTGMGFMRRLASPRMAVVAGASSSYPGVQNLLLAARALGLAANLTVWHFFAENEFKQVLGVPKQVTVYALVPVGWPASRFGPVRRRPVADVVHWDRW